MTNYVLHAEPGIFMLGTPARSPNRQLRKWLLLSVTAFMTGFWKPVGEAAGRAVVHALKWLYDWLNH